MDIYDILKLWCPAQLPLVSGCRNSGAPPPHFPHSPLHRSGLYFYIASALWNVRRILRTAPLGLRYHRALCHGRRDDRIRRISQAFHAKKPTLFIVTSWIIGNDEGHDSAIRSVCLSCYRTPNSATLCQDMFGNITTSSPKLCQLTSFLPIMRVVRQSQQKGK